MSLCGRLKCTPKNPGDNEGPAPLLSVCEPLAKKRKKNTLLCIWQQPVSWSHRRWSGLSSLSGQRFSGETPSRWEKVRR